MRKTPKCSFCGGTHYKINCLAAPKKPIRATQSRSKESLKPKGKSTRRKNLTRSKLKEKAWRAFSDYIRLRDCLITTGTLDYCICITCSERGCDQAYLYSEIQAGHAVGGRGNAVLFHEEIVNGQCGYCNRKPPMGLGGDYGNYAIALIKRYGLDHVQELQALKGKELKISTVELKEIEQKYKDKRAELIHIYNNHLA